MPDTDEVTTLQVLLIGEDTKTQLIADRLKSYREVSALERARLAEYAFGVIDRSQGSGVYVNTVFLDPFAEAFDPDKSSLLPEPELFILQTRAMHPEVVFVLLASDEALHRRTSKLPPKIRQRIGHYFRLDPALTGTALDSELNDTIARCKEWHKASNTLSEQWVSRDVAAAVEAAPGDRKEVVVAAVLRAVPDEIKADVAAAAVQAVPDEIKEAIAATAVAAAPSEMKEEVAAAALQAATAVAAPDEIRQEITSALNALASMGPREHRLRAFLCHSSSDKPTVRALYARLQSDNIRPWLDERDILPGRDWDSEIRTAIRTSDVVLVCLSQGSMTRSGYFHKEIRTVLEVADEQPEGSIFIIPVRLEPLDNVPERFRRWQWVDLFEETGYERLIDALRARANEQRYRGR